MIVVTVGTQLPFDRLVHSVDRWAAEHPDVEIVAQTGHASERPHHFRSEPFFGRHQLDALMAQSSLIVAHAGIGTILRALELQVPIIVMPRRAALGEHRNDHQLASAERLGARGLVEVADDEHALHRLLDRRDELSASRRVLEPPVELIEAIRRFVDAPPVSDSSGSTRHARFGR